MPRYNIVGSTGHVYNFASPLPWSGAYSVMSEWAWLQSRADSAKAGWRVVSA